MHKFKRIVAVLLSVLTVTAMLSVATTAYASETIDKVHFISVGGGDAILIESEGHYGLIDASNPSYENTSDVSPLNHEDFNRKDIFTGKQAAKYLNDIGVKSLDFVLATHSHSDHVGGIPDLVRAGDFVDSNTVYIYKEYDAVVDENASYEAAWYNGDYCKNACESMSSKGAKLLDVRTIKQLNTLDKKNAALKSCWDALSYKVVDGNHLDSINMQFGNFNIGLYNLDTLANYDENNNSILAYITKGSSKIALMGDMAHKEMIFAKHFGKVDVLQAGHHGAMNSTSIEFLNIVQPKSTIFLCSNADQISATKRHLPLWHDTFAAKIALLNKIGGTIYATGDLEPKTPANGSAAIVAEVSGTGVSLYNDIYSNSTRIAHTKSSKTDDFYNLVTFSEGWKKVYNAQLVNGDGAFFDAEWVYLYNNNGKWDYYNNTWKNIGGEWYYFTSSGIILKGFNKVGGATYYFDNNGKMKTGWQSVSGKWYLFKSDGAMLTGWQKVDGKWYYLAGDGHMLQEWQTVGGNKYYFGGNGQMRENWQKINNVWYYFGGNGSMRTGWQQIANKWYYLGSDGKMQTGWQKINNKWYAFDSSGAMRTGWFKENNKWYYLDSSGAMVTGRRTIDGKTYTFNSSGVMQ